MRLLHSALNAYLNAPRDDHRWIKLLSEPQLDQALRDIRPPIRLNPDLRVHQKACVQLGIAYPQFAFWLDMGCVSEDTLLETDQGPQKISDLARLGKPIKVWSLTNQGLQVVPASCPFPKGWGEMFRIMTNSGRWIDVFSKHAFLTQEGWFFCENLSVGTRLPVFDVSLPQSKLDTSLSKFHEDAPHLMNKEQGCLGHYQTRLCGEQLQREEDTFPAFFPLPDEILKHNHSALREDVLDNEYTSKDLLLFVPPSNSHCAFQHGFSSYHRESFHFSLFGSKQSPNYSCIGELDQIYANQLLQENVVLASGFGEVVLGADTSFEEFCNREDTSVQLAHSSQAPPQSVLGSYHYPPTSEAFPDPSGFPLETIIHIKPLGKKVYYDLHVPNHENYIAHGFCHHNTGKTLISLELLRYWWDCKKLRRALIFVTSDKAFPTWEAQIKRWKIDIPYITLDASSSAAKWKILADFQEGLIIVTYPGAVAMATKLVKDNKGKNKLKLDGKMVKKLASNLDALILDESTRCGNIGSLTTQLCARLRKSAKFCYALAGRPFGRDPTLLWSQFYIVDGGQTLGETLGLFRAAFYRAEENRWKPEKVRQYAPDYIFQKRMMPQLMRIVQHRSLAYAAEECIDLPKFQNIVEEVNLPQEAGAYYKRVVDQIIAARGNLELMKSAFIRMRQLSSGFLGFRDDETGDRVEIAFAENPKLDLLLDLLSSLPDERKAVVFYEHTIAGRKIVASLQESGYNPIWLWSGTKNSKSEIKKFQMEPSCSIAVINNKVGAFSLDGLQEVANYIFFYESPVGVIERDQAEKRLIRQGQKLKVFVYDLIVKGTLDAKILEFHHEGKELFQALMREPSLLLK